jgi:hypothetical protein
MAVNPNRRKKMKLKVPLVCTVTAGRPADVEQVTLVTLLKAEKRGVFGITELTTDFTLAEFTVGYWVTATLAPSRTPFWTTWDTNKPRPQSTAAPTRTTRSGKIKVTSTRAWPLLFEKFLANENKSRTIIDSLHSLSATRLSDLLTKPKQIRSVAFRPPFARGVAFSGEKLTPKTSQP